MGRLCNACKDKSHNLPAGRQADGRPGRLGRRPGGAADSKHAPIPDTHVGGGDRLRPHTTSNPLSPPNPIYFPGAICGSCPKAVCRAGSPFLSLSARLQGSGWWKGEMRAPRFPEARSRWPSPGSATLARFSTKTSIFLKSGDIMQQRGGREGGRESGRERSLAASGAGGGGWVGAARRVPSRLRAIGVVPDRVASASRRAKLQKFIRCKPRAHTRARRPRAPGEGGRGARAGSGRERDQRDPGGARDTVRGGALRSLTGFQPARGPAAAGPARGPLELAIGAIGAGGGRAGAVAAPGGS